MLSWPWDRNPDRFAIKIEGQEMTFRQGDNRIKRLATPPSIVCICRLQNGRISDRRDNELYGEVRRY